MSIETAGAPEISHEEARIQELMNQIREASKNDDSLREFARQQVETQIQQEKALEDKGRIINRAYRDHLNKEVLSPMAFPQRLLVSIKAARETGGVLAIAVADLDNFKAYNDSEGHPAGDKILSDVGDALNEVESGVVDPSQIFAATQAINQAGHRNTDASTQITISDLINDMSTEPSKPTITRKGGDEYVAIWPGTTNAILVAARAQQLFAEKQAKAEQDQRRVKAKVGITFGVRFLDFSAEEFDPDDRVVAKMALQDADDALYAAKLTQKGSILEHNPKDPRIQARQASRKAS